MLVSKLLLTPAAVVLLALAAGGGLAVAPEPPAAPRAARRAYAPVPARQPEWKQVFALEHTGPVMAAAYGREFIATFDADRPKSQTRLWRAVDGKASGLDDRSIWFPHTSACILRFTKDDTHLVMANHAVIMGTTTGSTTRYRGLPGRLVSDTMGSFCTIAFSADLSTIVNWEFSVPGRPRRKDRLFLHGDPWTDPKNFLKHKAVLEYPGGRAVTHADLSADGRRLAVAGDDAVIRVYDPASLRELHAVALKKGQKLRAVRLSDDGGRLAAVGEGGFARVFDAATGAETCELRGHTGTVAAVAFSPDGKRVATAAGPVVRVYDARSGKPGGEIAGHTGEVKALAFGPDGDRLVTGSADHTAKVWALKP